MSVVPDLEILFEMPTNITPAAKRSEYLVESHAVAYPPYEPPVTPTRCGIDQADLDEVVDGVNKVVELGPGGVALTELGELHPAPCAATVVGQEDGEAARREHLCGARVARQPAIGAMAFRPAVHHHDQRHTLVTIALEGVNEQSLELEAVARSPGDGLLAAQLDLVEPGVAAGQANRARTVK